MRLSEWIGRIRAYQHANYIDNYVAARNELGEKLKLHRSTMLRLENGGTTINADHAADLRAITPEPIGKAR